MYIEKYIYMYIYTYKKYTYKHTIDTDIDKYICRYTYKHACMHAYIPTSRSSHTVRTYIDKPQHTRVHTQRYLKAGATAGAGQSHEDSEVGRDRGRNQKTPSRWCSKL